MSMSVLKGNLSYVDVVKFGKGRITLVRMHLGFLIFIFIISRVIIHINVQMRLHITVQTTKTPSEKLKEFRKTILFKI